MRFSVDTGIFDISIDENLIKLAEKKLNDKDLRLALNKSAKRALTHLEKEIYKTLSQDTYIDKKIIKPLMSARVDYGEGKAAMKLFASGKFLNLRFFDFYPRKRPKTRMHGLDEKIYRARAPKHNPDGFLLRDNEPWERLDGKEKWYWIVQDTGPSLASLIKYIPGGKLEKLADDAVKTLEKNFKHEVLFKLGMFAVNKKEK